MGGKRTSVICPIICLCCLLLTACTSTPTPSTTHTTHKTPILPTQTPMPTPLPTPTPTTPTSYTQHILLQGVGSPDDLLFDQQGQILFSDPDHGTVSLLHNDGTVSILLRGLAAPEGLVLLSNNTLIVSEQNTNRILAFPPGSTTPTILRTLPSAPDSTNCVKEGIDNITLDPTNNTLIIPDSPTGVVYRMSLDGKTLTQLASGLIRPVGATVDPQGNIYVADECGGSIWRITPTGTTTQIGGFHMPDDVALDTWGNLYVIDLAPTVHALIRLNLANGVRTTLAEQGFREPQGLLVNAQGQIIVSDDKTDEIVELSADPQP